MSLPCMHHARTIRSPPRAILFKAGLKLGRALLVSIRWMVAMCAHTPACFVVTCMCAAVGAGASPAELCAALDRGSERRMHKQALSRVLRLQAFVQSFRSKMGLRLDSGTDTPVLTAWDDARGAG